MLIMPVSTSDGLLWFCFFNDTATTEIYTLSLHDALPISIYEFLSFDFGPTLLDWMDGGAPSVFVNVALADRASRGRVGHGNALAMPYHHIILPLATRRDKETEVRWGIAHFKRLFRRDPVGFWLPETAVDRETLDVLAAEGIQFTVLAPHQVSKPPAHGLPARIELSGR